MASRKRQPALIEQTNDHHHLLSEILGEEGAYNHRELTSALVVYSSFILVLKDRWVVV